MKTLLSLAVGFICLVVTAQTQTIPKEIWGKWVVTRELPARTISCWGEKEAKALLGTEIEYSRELFRWKNIVTNHPVAKTEIVTAAQFHDDNSGHGRDSSQVTFAEIGITAKEARQIWIQHPPANITGATIEIPGDSVLIKDKDSVVFSVCGLYFEAERANVPSQPVSKPVK